MTVCGNDKNLNCENMKLIHKSLNWPVSLCSNFVGQNPTQSLLAATASLSKSNRERNRPKNNFTKRESKMTSNLI